jgi:hypothetical protein
MRKSSINQVFQHTLLKKGDCDLVAFYTLWLVIFIRYDYIVDTLIPSASIPIFHLEHRLCWWSCRWVFTSKETEISPGWGCDLSIDLPYLPWFLICEIPWCVVWKPVKTQLTSPNYGIYGFSSKLSSLRIFALHRSSCLSLRTRNKSLEIAADPIYHHLPSSKLT